MLLLLLIGFFTTASALYENKFVATNGCRQYNSNHGYNVAHPFFSTLKFKNIIQRPGKERDDNRTIIRLGVLAKHDGLIRLASTPHPFSSRNKLYEIVLSGWGNTNHEVRSYYTINEAQRDSVQAYTHQSSHGALSEFVPYMFTMEFLGAKGIRFTKDGDRNPFLEVNDLNALPHEYIGFCNWDVPAIYFFDCPLLDNEK
ncbi:uncharacterized protein LOC131688686 [Topomyia yanbarensis]|uniref:uncharacterized protein LOC131688686 n=1 Tax=Topomyia yanbarensis TaxID=2498891 RepID=UPI00273AF9DF|nr:uncharacterized protein LOC131688686 [Topomyia yanbarensis]